MESRDKSFSSLNEFMQSWDKMMANTRRQPTLDNLVPYMTILSLMVFSSLLPQWQYRSWAHRQADLMIWFSCLVLHYFNRPVLSLGLSVAHITWTFLPGSLSSMKLPSHSTFMRSLSIVPTAQAGQEVHGSDRECMICWAEKSHLARLPCGHHYCQACLQLMGQHYQTACPMCRRPLFNVHDRAVFVLSKASVVCSAVGASLLLFTGILAMQRREYWSAMAAFSLMLGKLFHVWFTRNQVAALGENWWRASPSPQSAPTLKVACFAAGSGILNLASLAARFRAGDLF